IVRIADWEQFAPTARRTPISDKERGIYPAEPSFNPAPHHDRNRPFGNGRCCNAIFQIVRKLRSNFRRFIESLWDSGAAGHYSELVIHKGTPANVHTPSFSERRSISARRRGGLTKTAVANNPKPPIAAGPRCGLKQS